MIVKGHPSHPGTSELVARELSAAVADAGLPAGTFAHLPAASLEVAQALVDAPAIAAVGFTGSYAGGRSIADRAAARPEPIPVFAEMGSVNPIVVTEAALGERADAIADGLTASVANFGGQLCTKPGVVFVPAGEAGDAFAADVAGTAGRHRADRAAQRAPARRAARRRRAARAAERLGGAEEAEGPGFRHQPTAYRADASALAANPELLDEHFGPVVLFLTYGSRDELLAALDRFEGQLTGTLHAQAGEDVAAVVERAARAGGPRDLRRLPDRRRGHLRHAPRRPVPVDQRARAHVGRDDRDPRWLRPVAFQNAPESYSRPRCARTTRSGSGAASTAS